MTVPRRVLIGRSMDSGDRGRWRTTLRQSLIVHCSTQTGLKKTTTMSFKKGDLYPCNPATARGESTKLSSSGDKVVYTNGRTVVVSDARTSVRK